MSCNITSGISKGCRSNAGGISEIYLAAYPTGYTALEWMSESNGTVTGISGATFYTFVPNKNSSNYVENIMSTIENGSIGYEQVITYVTAKNDIDKRNAIYVLGQNNLIAIVRDKNESYWLLGSQNGLEVSGGSNQSGTLLNDLAGWSITITGQEPAPAYAVSSTIIDGLVAD
jgi:hypothetical protein